MEERRKFKSVQTDEGKQMYRQLNIELRRETDRAREEWWRKECGDLEELVRGGRSDLMYDKVKQLMGQNRSLNKSSGIKDDGGKLVTEPEEIKNRWKQYVETLYDRDGKPTMSEMEIEKLRYDRYDTSC